jgi:hypothetical protein
VEKLKFYDMRARKVFHSNEYEYVVKDTSRGKVQFAVTDAPSGVKSWRIVKKL